jgi:AcrR family transcriptional regulator
MPKIVDHEVRRRELAEALWRVVVRDGIDHVSVRSVAAEAGWSPGALRHYFDSQDQLLLFAMDSAADAMRRRIAALPQEGSWRDQALVILHQMLPLDAERRAETAAWFAFSARAQADPALRQRRGVLHDELRAGVVKVLGDLAELGVVRSDLDVPAEADRLHALLDGLCLHALTRPRQLTADRMRAAVASHLESLAP